MKSPQSGNTATPTWPSHVSSILGAHSVCVEWRLRVYSGSSWLSPAVRGLTGTSRSVRSRASHWECPHLQHLTCEQRSLSEAKGEPRSTAHHQLLRFHEQQPWTGHRTSPHLCILAQVKAGLCFLGCGDSQEGRWQPPGPASCCQHPSQRLPGLPRHPQARWAHAPAPFLQGAEVRESSVAPRGRSVQERRPVRDPSPGAEASRPCARGGLLSSSVSSASERSANSVKSWKVSMLDFAGHIWSLLHIVCSCVCFLPCLKNVKPICIW